MKLKGKVAIVTGGGSGIGKAAAVLFAREGARVGVISHTPDTIETAAKEIEESGGEAMALVADVREPEPVRRAYEELVGKWGRIDVVFANAGINGVWAPIEDLKPEEWDRTLQTNLKGTFLTIKYAVPHLKTNGGGSVIVTSSVNGTRIFSNTGATAYSASKAGQVALVQMLALELSRWKIRVNAICPGWITTGIEQSTERRNLEEVEYEVQREVQVPLTGGKAGSPEQVAKLALFLASDASDHITGTPIWIDGAESLLQG